MSKERIVLIYANEQNQSQQIALTLKESLTDSTAFQLYNPAIHTTGPDYIISIGGDGTLLAAFHRYFQWIDTAKFIGIHTGHLGFYTDWRPHQVKELIEALNHSDGESVSYPLLKIETTLANGTVLNQHALNEWSIRSQFGTMVLDIMIKDYFFETFRGDGVCIATPTGSTGLSKSLGGAVVHPRLDAMQLTEMASINNRVYRTLSSPMIIPKDEWIQLLPHDTHQPVALQVDHLMRNDVGVQKINIRIAKERIQFARFRHLHFWDRVENAFIGRKAGD